jgi:hypothetical protein
MRQWETVGELNSQMTEELEGSQIGSFGQWIINSELGHKSNEQEPFSCQIHRNDFPVWVSGKNNDPSFSSSMNSLSRIKSAIISSIKAIEKKSSAFGYDLLFDLLRTVDSPQDHQSTHLGFRLESKRAASHGIS